MLIPEKPQNPGPFNVQHGYGDDSAQPQLYQDQPTPFAGQQGKAQEFFNKHTDKEHQKKYGKNALNQGFNLLMRFVCN